MFKFYTDVPRKYLGEISFISNAEGSLANMKPSNEGYDVACSL